MSDPLLANRLVRAVIPYLTKPLLPQLEAKAAEPTDTGGSSKRKGKKRARGYEGDEVFKTNPDVLFGSPHEERVVMHSIEALRLLSRDTGISPEVYSVSSRLLLSLLLHLSRLPPSLVSKDVTFHNDLSSKLQSVCIELASTKSAALGRTLPLLMNLLDQKDAGGSCIPDLLLHPRLPPLVRQLPSVENVALFRVEESEAGQELRGMLGLGAPEHSEPAAPAREPPQRSSEELPNPAQVVELPPPSHPAPDSASWTPNLTGLPAQPPNYMQVDQSSVMPPVTLPQSQAPAKNAPPIDSTQPVIGVAEEPPQPVLEPPQLPPWNPIGFAGDEDEEEDEIPSINMESDSD